jgi:hypothetical protein
MLWAACLLSAQDPPPDVTHVLEVEQGYVERLETSVPNFICNERIVSQMYSNTKVKKETRAQAVLTTTRSIKDGRGTFTESRAEMSINGKPSKRNEIDGPFVWQGGPAYGDLHFLFNSDHGEECRTYRLGGRVKLDGRDALLMQVHALAGLPDTCHDLPADSADEIWLEPQSLNVIRIESHDPPATRIPGADLTLTVDYAPVVFDGAEYWLPSHFISRLDFPGTPKHFQYEAFFADYHKYGAESVIHIDSNQ